MGSDIDGWLIDLGLGKYRDVFAANEIALDDLPEITEDDLEELGLPIGPRRRALKAITELRDRQMASPTPDGPEALPHPRVGQDAERRQLTVLFCDLVGSTELSQQLDPEDLREVMRAYQSRVASEITGYGGHVAKFMGDAVIAYFGYPVAHEDDAARAIHSALSIVRAVRELARDTTGPLQVRIGIATGRVVVGDLIGEGAAQEEAVLGVTPNLAARLQAVAGPGRVVISEATKSLVGRRFVLAELASLDLKGLEGPVTAYEVSGERRFESRFEARSSDKVLPLIGREQELALLRERWRQARAGEGQMVFLSGEAGIGKSRITRALIDAVAGDDNIRVTYQCSPYHADSALHPAVRQLNMAARIQPEDTNQIGLDKLEALLSLAGESNAMATALIAELIGLDGEVRHGKLDLSPQQRRNRTLDALADQLVGLSRAKPVLFVVEDAHWIDATTLEFLDLCLDHVGDAPVFILVTARPTFTHGFGGHPNVTRLALNRLGRDHILAIAEGMTDGKVLPAELLDEIVARTDGVPLFVEELTKTLLESDGLTETDDAYVLEGSLSRLAIPATLHASLMARLDRLQPVKEVAQSAACIGRQFDFPLLPAISPLDDGALGEALDQLEGAELLFRRGVPPDARYTFKHALVRDTAYESLLLAKRRILHGRIARSLETDFAGRVEAEPELVAHHFVSAGDFERGIHYWQLAARRAVERSAHRDAVEHLTRALEVLPELPEDGERIRSEVELQARLGMAYTATKGQAAPEVESAFLRARELCRRVPDAYQLFAVLRGLWLCYQVGSRLDAAREIGHELLQLAQSRESSTYAVESYRALGQTALWRGDFAMARDHFEHGLELYDPAAHGENAMTYGQDPFVVSSCMAGAALWILGYPERADRLLRRAVEHADHLNHPYSRAVVGIVTTFVYALLRDVEQSRIEADRTIALATDYELPFFLAFATVYRGRALVLCGSLDDGMAEIRRGLDMPVPKTEAWWPFALVDSCLAAGRFEEAREALNDALAVVDRTGDRLVEAELRRLKGVLLLRCDEPSDREVDAERCFGQAISIARDQQAKSWELRAATSLATLWRDQGRRDTARDLLAPIHGWFREGFDTPDLKDAEALLLALE